MRKIFLIAILMLAWPALIFAADYCVDIDGDSSIAGPCVSDDCASEIAAGTCYDDLRDVIDYIETSGSATNTLYVQDGEYTDARNFFLLDHANHSGLTVIGESQDGTIINVTGGGARFLYVAAAADDVTIRKMTFYTNNTAQEGLSKADGADNLTLDQLTIIQSPNHNHHLIYLAGDTTNITNCKIFGGLTSSSRFGLYAANADNDGVIRGNLFAPNQYNAAINPIALYGTGTSYFDHNIVIGSRNYAVILNNASGTYYVRGNFLSGGILTGNPTIYNGAGTEYIYNNHIISPLGDPDDDWILSVPDGGDGTNILTNEWPLWSGYRGGFIIPCIDDKQNIDDAQALASKLSDYGYHGTFYVELVNSSGSLSSEEVSNLRSLIENGIMEVASHSHSHVNETYDHAMTFNNTTGANCTVAVNTGIITLNCDGTDYDETIDTTTASYDTIAEVVAYNGTKGWSVSKSATDSQNTSFIHNHTPLYTDSVSVLSDQSAAAVPGDVDFDRTGYDTGVFYSEITYPKTALATLVNAAGSITDPQTGTTYTVNSFGQPYNASDTDARAAIKSAGYTNGRGFADGDYHEAFLTATDLYYGSVFGATSLLGADEAATRQAARSIGHYVVANGLIVWAMGHDMQEGDITSEQWDWLLDEWSQIPGLTVTSAQLATATIRTSGNWRDDGVSPDDTASDGIWSRAYPSAVYDFSLTQSSPLISAGLEAETISFTETQTDGIGNEYFFAPYDRLNIGIDQSRSDAALRPTSGGKIIGGSW